MSVMGALMAMTMIAIGAVTEHPLAGGPVEVVATGFTFTEGPVWTADRVMLFTDIPNDVILRTDKTEFRKPSGKANGLTLDERSRLVACEHWNRRVTRTEKDGTISVIADSYAGKKFNSPNDVAVRNDGVLFFTDPDYGLEGREKEQPCNGVYAVMPDGNVKLLGDDFKKPNGIALSVDQKSLYVADTEGSHIRAFTVNADATLSDGKVLCPVPGPDGLRVDSAGNIWCTGEGGIHVFPARVNRLAYSRFRRHPRIARLAMTISRPCTLRPSIQFTRSDARFRVNRLAASSQNSWRFVCRAA